MITTAQANINWADPNVVNQYNLLTPINVTDERDMFQKSVVSLVQVSADKNDKDVYPQKGGGLSLSKTGLMKIAAAAGMQTTAKIEYIDKDTVIFSSKASYTDYSGQQREGTGTKEGKRNAEFALEKAESGAILRAIRGLLAIKTSYTAQELAKPFAIPHSVYAPDYKDPQVKQIALQKFAGTTDALYGEVPAQLEAPQHSPCELPVTPITEALPETQASSDQPTVTPKAELPASTPSGNPPCKQCQGETVIITGESPKGPWKAYGCKDKCGARLDFINEKKQPPVSDPHSEYPDYS